MTDLKFNLLSMLYNVEQAMHENDLLNHFLSDLTAASNALDDLKKDELVECDISGIRYTLSTAGRAMFEVLQESRDRETKNRRRQYIQYWITTAIALAAFIKSFFLD